MISYKCLNCDRIIDCSILDQFKNYDRFIFDCVCHNTIEIVIPRLTLKAAFTDEVIPPAKYETLDMCGNYYIIDNYKYIPTRIPYHHEVHWKNYICSELVRF